MDTAFDRFESATLFSLGYLEEPVCEGRREPFANLKDLQKVILDKLFDVDIRQPQSKKAT